MAQNGVCSGGSEGRITECNPVAVKNKYWMCFVAKRTQNGVYFCGRKEQNFFVFFWHLKTQNHSHLHISLIFVNYFAA